MKKEIQALLSVAKQVSGNYSEAQTSYLPEPVRRYFKYALKNNQRLISNARLIHGGQFKPSKKWMPISGEEYFTVDPPGFAWFAKLRFISGKDTYYDGSGRMQIKLFSVIKLVDGKGEDFNQGELVRWLSETPWFPTALLPSENVRWAPVDAASANVTLTDHGLNVAAVFFFNEMGQITKFVAKRPGEGKLQDWICQYSDYREVDGMHIPFCGEASWVSESEDAKYAKFRIEKIEYDAVGLKIGMEQIAR